jgi:hypothetical protein
MNKTLNDQLRPIIELGPENEDRNVEEGSKGHKIVLDALIGDSAEKEIRHGRRHNNTTAEQFEMPELKHLTPEQFEELVAMLKEVKYRELKAKLAESNSTTILQLSVSGAFFSFMLGSLALLIRSLIPRD